MFANRPLAVAAHFLCRGNFERALAEVCTQAVGVGETDALTDRERESLGVKVPVTEEVTDHDAETAAEAVMRRVTRAGV